MISAFRIGGETVISHLLECENCGCMTTCEEKELEEIMQKNCPICGKGPWKEAPDEEEGEE